MGTIHQLPWPCRFDLEHYRFILTRAWDLGYNFLTHQQYHCRPEVKDPLILLRHDIDLSLKSALPLVRLEHELGVKSTIFLRIHASGYNPFDIDNYAVIRQFVQWGCEIGLHYEPLFMLLTQEDPLDQLRRAKAVIESILDRPVYGLTSHAPRLSPLLKNLNHDQMCSLGFAYNAGDPGFTRDNYYLSDANRRWGMGCPCQHLGRKRRITMVVHPVWWHPMTPGEQYQTIDLLRQGR